MFMTTGAPQTWVTPFARDRLVDRRGLDPPHADMRPGESGNGPREAPAVAVKHRQGPEIDRMLPHAPDQDVAERIQVGVAMVIDDTLSGSPVVPEAELSENRPPHYASGLP
jgi:hypothetical protein